MLELNNFEQIDINSFFDADTSSEESQKIEVLTKKQRSLINETMPIVTALDPERAKIFKNIALYNSVLYSFEFVYSMQ